MSTDNLQFSVTPDLNSFCNVMVRLKLVGLVLNKRQLVLYKTTKDHERIALLLVEKKYKMKSKNSVVTQNVTRDFSICLRHNSLALGQIATKL
jgi:hypothetical protein